MAKQPLSPQGYNLGGNPKNTNPFFELIKRGVTATIEVGQVIVNTLLPGSNATVEIENVGTETDGVFDFTFGIPQGAKGDKGDKGDPGEDGQNGVNGTDGVTPQISATATVDQTVGQATVNVTKSGTDEAPVFNFAFSGIKGQDGSGSGSSLPSGGEPGQVLEKYGSGDGQAYWADKNAVPLPNINQVGMVLKALGENVFGWASSSGGGGGSSVSVAQNIKDAIPSGESGQIGSTKIGTITVDNQAVDLYSPINYFTAMYAMDDDHITSTFPSVPSTLNVGFGGMCVKTITQTPYGKTTSVYGVGGIGQTVVAKQALTSGQIYTGVLTKTSGQGTGFPSPGTRIPIYDAATGSEVGHLLFQANGTNIMKITANVSQGTNLNINGTYYILESFFESA